KKKTVICVPQMNPIQLWRRSLLRKRNVYAGIRQPVLREVLYCGKQYVKDVRGFRATRLGSLKIIAKFQCVTRKRLRQVNACGVVVFVQGERRDTGTDKLLRGVAEETSYAGRSKEVDEYRRETQIQMRRPRNRWFAAALKIGIQKIRLA